MGIIIAAIMLLVHYAVSGNSTPPPQKSELGIILKKRYARGETSKEEFQEKKKELLE